MQQNEVPVASNLPEVFNVDPCVSGKIKDVREDKRINVRG